MRCSGWTSWTEIPGWCAQGSRPYFLPLTSSTSVEADDWLIEHPFPVTSRPPAVVLDLYVQDDLVAAQVVEPFSAYAGGMVIGPGLRGCGSDVGYLSVGSSRPVSVAFYLSYELEGLRKDRAAVATRRRGVTSSSSLYT